MIRSYQRHFLTVALAIVVMACPKPPVVEETLPAEPAQITQDYLNSLTDDVLRGRDSDKDGLSDFDELRTHNTNPLAADTDGDGLNDFDEVMKQKTDPTKADTDGDGLSDGNEVNVHKTNPLNADSDGDGLSDGAEINTHRTNPNSADSDGDGLSDYDEVITHKTNPNNPDSDGDGFTDGQEVQMGTNPSSSADPVYIRSLHTVNFGFDLSNIDTQAAQALTDNVSKLRGASNINVRVDAYTDHIGGDQYNLRLSVRRANAVRDFYVSNGIAEGRIQAQGLGKAPVPCASDDVDGKGCRANRRAETVPLNNLQFTPRN